MSDEYERLKAKARQLVAEGQLNAKPTDEQRADFGRGNARFKLPPVPPVQAAVMCVLTERGLLDAMPNAMAQVAAEIEAKLDTAELWRSLTDEQRAELMGLCCTNCGRLDAGCQCWNDE